MDPVDKPERLRTAAKQRGLDSVDELVMNVIPFDEGLDDVEQLVNDAYDETAEIDGEEYPLFRYIKGMELSPAHDQPRQEGVVEEARLLANYIDPIKQRRDFGGQNDFEQGGDRLFIGVPTVYTVGLSGLEPWRTILPPAPNPTGPRNAAEMIDAYLMEQLRDVPTVEWPNELPEDVPEALPDRVSDILGTELDRIDDALDDGWWYDEDALFVEADTDEVDWGPYISQFLLQDLKLWALNADQEYLRYPEVDHNYTQDDWLSIIEGAGPYAAETNPKMPESGGEHTGPITTPRHLATMVNAEPPFQEYLIAAMRLLSMDFDQEFPLASRGDGPIFDYTGSGPVGLLDMLTRAGRQALLAAFYHKWRRHFRCRPETYSGRIHEQRRDHDFGIDALITKSSLLDRRTVATEAGRTDPDGDYLSSAYVEGSHMHPAYPSGHSVIAGASGTVLKTWFPDTELPFDDILVPEPDGQGVEAVDSDQLEAELTVHQEIDKLISNVGLARMFAGVHYYSDHYRGVKLGEQVAVGLMIDIFKRKYIGDEEFELTFTPYLEHDTEEVNFDTLNELRENAHDIGADELWVTS
jgi:hypothetical protein